jgi:hypothetical protein
VALKKEAAGAGDGPDLVEAVHKLFDLPAVQPVGPDETSSADAVGESREDTPEASSDVQKASRP